MKHVARIVLALLIALITAGTASAEPWPYMPFDETHGVGNHFGEYQNYGGSPYYHDGIDLVTPDGPTDCYSVSTGTVTHLAFSQPYYSGIMIGEPVAGGEGWLYWHINSTTFQFDVGDPVQVNDYIGTTAYWPVAAFHHTHFNRVQGTDGYPWGWYIAIDNPLLYMEPNDDPDAPEFLITHGGNIFAFRPNGSGTILDPMNLSGDVDIVSRIADTIGLPQWPENPWKIDYWIEGATQAVSLTNSVTFSGQIPPDNTVTVIYSTQSPLVTLGDYDDRIYYFVVTNTDGDGFVESGDASYCWHTGLFNPGDYWVTVQAEDIGGTVVTESMLCRIAGTTNPDIDLPEESHDFGKVPPLWSTTWNLPVVNLGVDHLSVRDIVSTNPVFRVDQTHFYVPPDSGVVEVEVTFAPTWFEIYQGELQITTDDPDEPLVTVALQGEGGRPDDVGDLQAEPSFGIRGTRALGRSGLEVSYDLDRSETAVLEVFDPAGRHVCGAQIMGAQAGSHRWHWDGANDAGQRMPSGVYFVRLRMGERTSVESGILLR